MSSSYTLHSNFISIPDHTSDVGVPTTRLTIDEMFSRFGERGNYLDFHAIDDRLYSIHDAKEEVKHLTKRVSKCIIS